MEVGVSLPGIAIAWAATFVSGFLWFGPKTLFPAWWKAMGHGESDVPGGGRNMAITFGSVVVGQLVSVIVLALLMGPLVELGRIGGALDGALFGLLVGVGIAAATALGHRMFAGHGPIAWIIESGNDIVNLGIAGAILATLR